MGRSSSSSSRRSTLVQWLSTTLFLWSISISSNWRSGSSSCLLFVHANTPTVDRTGYIPCSQTCNGGDVNYDLTASVRTMPLLGKLYRGRTYSTPDSDSFMGPTLTVKPGQSLWIKLTNNLTDDTLGPHPPTATDYWRMLKQPGEKIKYQFYKQNVADPSLLHVDHANMANHFDVTNLHLHGLDIAVHMFDPVGTHDPAAPHIAIQPGQCYCYKFDIPDHHPPGLYWYHPHVHGSSAIQIWSGMLGILHVQGPLLDELEQYNVQESHKMVIWDPALQAVQDQDHDLEVDEFLLGQTTLSKIHPFLVNGQVTPHLATVQVGQVLHLRVVCATIENENTFIVYREGEETLPWKEAAIPFWVIASDGVTYPQPINKTIIVLAGGQREEILLQFDEPGTYVISQQGIEGMQFFGMMGHPHNQILATITVTNATDDNDSLRPNTLIDEMVFTPGYLPEETIDAANIVGSETIVFSMGANRDQIPFPQYYVNGKPFDANRLDLLAQPGEAREYILINANHNVHPFHIHVNRFQVQEMGSELSIDDYPVLEAVMDFNKSIWRDTVVVPPSGRTRIWIQYKNYTGKTVFHCHFLAHEDTGMMATLFIGPQDYHFQWKDHEQLLLGIVVGALVSSVVLLLWAFRSKPSRYAPVVMNELKSKAQD